MSLARYQERCIRQQLSVPVRAQVQNKDNPNLASGFSLGLTIDLCNSNYHRINIFFLDTRCESLPRGGGGSHCKERFTVHWPITFELIFINEVGGPTSRGGGAD